MSLQKLFISSSEYAVVGIYTRTIFSLLRCYAQNKFHVLFMRKPTPAWPLFALEWYSRWPHCKIMKHSSRLLSSPITITSHTSRCRCGLGAMAL